MRRFPASTKIDIGAKENIGKLTQEELQNAFAIWRRMQVFDFDCSDVSTVVKYFKETEVWDATFKNYDPESETHQNKMKRYVTQIMDYSRTQLNLGCVDRIAVRDGTEWVTVICKPDRDSALTKYNRSIGSAASNYKNAHVANSGSELGRILAKDFITKLEDMEQIDIYARRELYLELMSHINNQMKATDQLLNVWSKTQKQEQITQKVEEQ